MSIIETPYIPPECADVLDPDFAATNAAAGYDPNYDFVGSDYIYQRYGIAFSRVWFGADINPAAFLHDKAYDCGHTVSDFNAANLVFEANVHILIEAKGHPWLAFWAGWVGWLGVSSLPSLINYFLSAKLARLRAREKAGIEQTCS